MSFSGNLIFIAGNLATSPASFAAQAEAAGVSVSTLLVAGPGADVEVVAAAAAGGVTVVSEAEFSRVFLGGGAGAAAEEAEVEALGGDLDAVTARGFVRGTPLVHSGHSSRATLSGIRLKLPPPFSFPSPAPPLPKMQVLAARAALFEAEVAWEGVELGGEKIGAEAAALSAFPGGLGTAGPVPAPHASLV
jgi:hypothetical protein